MLIMNRGTECYHAGSLARRQLTNYQGRVHSVSTIYRFKEFRTLFDQGDQTVLQHMG